MSLKNNASTYGLLSKLLHWSSAAILIALIAVGIYMAGLPDDAEGRGQLYGLHKSFGVLALLLIAVRLIWLRVTPAPALPGVFDAKEQRVVKGIQALLYATMVLVPVSGYLMSNAGGYPIHFFGLFELPALVEKSKALGGFVHEAHWIMGYAMAALVLLHMAGAIKHRLKAKGSEADILQRMI